MKVIKFLYWLIFIIILGINIYNTKSVVDGLLLSVYGIMFISFIYMVCYLILNKNEKEDFFYKEKRKIFWSFAVNVFIFPLSMVMMGFSTDSSYSIVNILFAFFLVQGIPLMFLVVAFVKLIQKKKSLEKNSEEIKKAD